ncbi:MAG: glycosyl hydrolase, partial [Gemmatimonadota bacterium]
LIYIPSRRLGGSGQAFQGAAYYEADNPPFGADITYYLKSGIQTREQKRHAEEKKLRDAGEPVPYPSFAEMRAEDQEEAPYLLFTITDDQGNVVRRLRTNARAGMHRIAWDLRYMATTPVRVASNGGRGFGRGGMGPLVVPGTYHVSLDKVVDGVVSHLVDPVAFKVVPLNNATLAAQDKAALLAFQKQAGELMGRIRAAGAELSEAANRLRYIRAAIPLTPAAPDSLLAEARALQQRVDDLDIKLNGDRSVARRQFETPPSISQRISSVVYASYSATSAPGGAQKEQVRIAADEFQPVHAAIVKLLSDLDAFEARLKQMGAPYTPGQPPIQ